jgi:hypothetical protein
LANVEWFPLVDEDAAVMSEELDRTGPEQTIFLMRGEGAGFSELVEE